MSRFSRQIRGLQKLAKRLKPGSVPGALVDVTTGGAFVRPLNSGRRSGTGSGGGPAKWM